MDSKHEWTEKDSSYLIEADGSVYEDVEGVGHPQIGEVPRFVAREIMRLAAEVKSLKNSETVLVQERYQDRAEEREIQARALAAERDQLAAEVERLKGRHTNGEALAGRRSAATAERRRIRREMLEAIEYLSSTLIEGESVERPYCMTSGLLAALDRIIPEEG